MECVFSKFDRNKTFCNGEGESLLVQLGLREETTQDAFDMEDVNLTALDSVSRSKDSSEVPRFRLERVLS